MQLLSQDLHSKLKKNHQDIYSRDNFCLKLQFTQKIWLLKNEFYSYFVFIWFSQTSQIWQPLQTCSFRPILWSVPRRPPNCLVWSCVEVGSNSPLSLTAFRRQRAYGLSMRQLLQLKKVALGSAKVAPGSLPISVNQGPLFQIKWPLVQCLLFSPLSAAKDVQRLETWPCLWLWCGYKRWHRHGWVYLV